jgi:hypothetical protein
MCLFYAPRHTSRNECFYHLIMMSVKEYSFDNLTHFSKGNSVEDTPASFFHCVFKRHACIFSFHPHRLFYCKVNDSSIWKCWQVGCTFDIQICSQRALFSNRLKLLPSKICYNHPHVSLTSAFQLTFLKVNVAATWKLWLIHSIPLTAEPSSQREVMCITLQCLTFIILFQGIYVSLTFRSTGFLTYTEYIPLEHAALKMYFVEIHTYFLKENVVIFWAFLFPCHYTSTYMCLFYSARQPSFPRNVCFFNLKSMTDRKYSFHRLTQFSMGTNV